MLAMGSRRCARGTALAAVGAALWFGVSAGPAAATQGDHRHGCYGERVTEPDAIVPAIKRALAKIDEGQPALLEFITERQSPRSSEAPPGGH